MQKTLIAVQATKRRGKTQSIALAHQKLLEQGAEVMRRPIALRGRCLDVRQAILKIDGVLVGFASSGDDHEKLKKDLTALFVAECSVIVCATHTSTSESARAMRRFAEEHGYNVVPLAKERSAVIHEGRDNANFAERIISEIRQAIEDALSAAA